MEALVVSGVIGLFGAIVALGVRHNDRRRKLWVRAAAERGGRHIASRGLSRGQQERLEIQVGATRFEFSGLEIDSNRTGAGAELLEAIRAGVFR